MDFKEATFHEGAGALLSAMDRLTVLRGMLDTPPMAALRDYLEALARRELDRAANRYHALTAALLSPGSRRVSGDLFLDYLLGELLESPNPFSLRAARGIWEEPLAAAMRADLTQLQRLAGINSVTLKRWAGEQSEEAKMKPRQGKDNISAISSAVWGGNISRPLPPPGPAPQAQEENPKRMEQDWLSWRYAVGEEKEEYVADEALEEIYRRLIHSQDWGLLLDDIWNFHSTCGAGREMLQSRVFRLEPGGELTGLPAHMLPPEEDITLYGPERELIQGSVIRFMQGDGRAENLLVTGPAGTGKTTQILGAARELPEVRLILAEGADAASVRALLPRLAAQPLRFVLFVDDIDFAAPGYPALRAALRQGGLQPDNVLLVAAAREGTDSLFPMTVQLREPPLKEFIELVRQILLREGVSADYDSLQNACIDCAAAGEGLSFPAAYRIADEFLGG